MTSTVAFELARDGCVVLFRVGTQGAAKRPGSWFALLRGDAGPGLTTDQIMALTRGTALG